jgi:hypothetical protein
MVGDNSKRITLFRNLISSNEERNPYLKPGSRTEMINNIVYGWGSNGGWSLCNLTNNEATSSPVYLTFVGNTYTPGPWSFITSPVYSSRLAQGSRIYVRDNRLLVSSPSFSAPRSGMALPSGNFETSRPPVRSRGTRSIPSPLAELGVLQNVGSRPFDRSPIDSRIIAEVQQRAGSIKDCIEGCRNAVGGWPKLTRATRPLTPPSKPFDDDNRDGYTNLENWIFSFTRARRS